MDYKKAQSLKNKSLLSLMAEKKFQEGQSIGSSVGGAISDKFKAKMTRTKEKFDPLNWVKGLTGSGVIGKSIRTMAGRALGRSEEDIGYFGGYQRKGKNKKDPKRTTIGKGPIKPLKMGDSTADILAKMYNFIQKTNQIALRNYEIDKKFREEQLEEDERRHKKLIESLTGKKTKQLEPEKKEEEKEQKEPSWVGKMLKAMKETVGSLLSGIMKGIGSTLSFILGILGKLTTLLAPILSLVGGIISSIVGSVAQALFLPITKLVGSMFKRFVIGVIGSLANFALGALAGPLRIGLAALLGTAGLVEANDYKRSVSQGPEAQEYEEQLAAIQQTSQYAEGTFGGEVMNSSQSEETMADLNTKIKESTNKYRKEKLAPMMEKSGWKTEIDKSGEVKFRKNGKFSEFVDEALVFEKNNAVKYTEDKLSNFVNSAKNEISSNDSESLNGLQSQIDDLRKLIEEKKQLYLKPTTIPENIIENENNPNESSITINSSANTIKEKTSDIIVDGNPLGVRNRNPIMNQILRSTGGTL